MPEKELRGSSRSNCINLKPLDSTNEIIEDFVNHLKCVLSMRPSSLYSHEPLSINGSVILKF